MAFFDFNNYMAAGREVFAAFFIHGDNMARTTNKEPKNSITYDYRGRAEIFTDVEEITDENIIPVLVEAYAHQSAVTAQCQFLLDYDAGIQPLRRKEPKSYRPDIDFTCIDNVANEISAFKQGFVWGYPITLTQRGSKDSGLTDEPSAISLLNECYQAEDIDKKTQALGRYVEICGIGFTYVDIKTDWEEGDSYFEHEVLDPRFAFIVKSSRYIDHRPMLGVSFRKTTDGDIYFTCFSKDKRYEIHNGKVTNGRNKKEDIWEPAERSGELNPLGAIPIVEWFRSYDRMGCFERQLSEMDNLNLLVSDFSNQVDQNTQSVWHTNDVEFPKQIITTTTENPDGSTNITTTEKDVKPDSGEWLSTFTSPDGKTPFIKPLTLDYDFDGQLNNYITRRALILQKACVPQRNDNSGGSTGVAMSDATGWSAAETDAQREQNIQASCKLEEVKLVLKAIRKSPAIDSDNPLLKLRYMDVQPNIKRQRTYELSVKTAALSNMVNIGVHGLHAMKTVNLFEDVNGAWNDSREMMEAIQQSKITKQQADEEPITTDGGLIAQVSNSPLIDGISKEEPVEADGSNNA